MSTMRQDTARLRRFRRYPAYRESGVQWLGDIPSHWHLRRLKTVASVRLSNVDKKSVEGEEPVRLCNYVDVYYNDHITSDMQFMEATATREQIKRLSLRAGDVVITKDSESWTDIAVPAVVSSDLPNVLCGYHLALVRPTGQVLGAFLSRAFEAVGPRDQFQNAANGITRFGLTGEVIRDGTFALPPVTEQHSIAAFIDRETARIDALVAKKERLIALLQEERDVLITRAVTEGLDAGAPMKASGIEWLDKIPAHWETMRLRWLVINKPKNGLSPPVGLLGGTPTFSITAVQNGVVNIHEHVKYADVCVAEGQPFQVLRGDVLLLRGSGSRRLVGKAGIVVRDPPKGCIYPDILIRVRPLPKLTAWFLVHSLNSSAIRPQVETAAKTAAGIWKIAGEDVVNFELAVPPLTEQLLIEREVSRRIALQDAASSRVRDAIDSLQELRTALISAAVTGKIDVGTVA